MKMLNKLRKFCRGLGVTYFIASMSLAVLTLLTLPSCKSVQQIDPTTGQTNTVSVLDTNKLAYVDATVSSVASGIYRRAIQRSPEHAAEIAAYVRATGSVFCGMKASGQFSPGLLLVATDKATAGLQADVPPEVIDGKNALLNLYQVLWNDQLTVAIPDNGWPRAVVTVICDAIDRSLIDSGHPGFSRKR